MSTVSTTVNEVIVTGRKKRRLIDKAAKLWQRISYWTKACDVEFDDGKTAQEKVGSINGITSNFKAGSDDIAASSSLTKKIKDDLNDGIINDHIQLVIMDNGKLGWKKDGADTVTPFRTNYNCRISANGSSHLWRHGEDLGGMNGVGVLVSFQIIDGTIKNISIQASNPHAEGGEGYTFAFHSLSYNGYLTEM